jgi:hypothetical protein
MFSKVRKSTWTPSTPVFHLSRDEDCRITPSVTNFAQVVDLGTTVHKSSVTIEDEVKEAIERLCHIYVHSPIQVYSEVMRYTTKSSGLTCPKLVRPRQFRKYKFNDTRILCTSNDILHFPVSRVASSRQPLAQLHSAGLNSAFQRIF